MPDPRAPTAATQIAELKVSGHTMLLEPGLYCIFSAPGGGAPDPSSGLPTVRIGPAPGARPGRIKTVGIEPEGWIGPDAATLVRVTEAASELLVTVYQAPNSRTDAPSIQVVRIGGGDAPMQPNDQALQPPPASGQVASTVEVIGHIYGRGDIGAALGEWVGEPGGKRWIEGFGIAPLAGVPASDIEYQAVLGRGWLSPWSEGGQFCGSRGMSLPILGLRVRLRGASAATHRIILSASFVDGTQVGPVGDAEACEAPSLAALEAFQIAIVPAGTTAGPAKKPAAKAPAAKPPAAKPPAAKAPAAKPPAAKGKAPKEPVAPPVKPRRAVTPRRS